MKEELWWNKNDPQPDDYLFSHQNAATQSQNILMQSVFIPQKCHFSFPATIRPLFSCGRPHAKYFHSYLPREAVEKCIMHSATPMAELLNLGADDKSSPKNDRFDDGTHVRMANVHYSFN